VVDEHPDVVIAREAKHRRRQRFELELEPSGSSNGWDR
jgi:hypothetical protein